MGGRMNWDRARRDSLSSRHGTERFNPHSLPTQKKKNSRQPNDKPHSNTCRCEACKAYLQLIKQLNPERFKEMTKNSQPPAPPDARTKNRLPSDAFRFRNRLEPFPKSTWKEKLPIGATPTGSAVMVGCTCGKTLEFAGLHKTTCAMKQLQLLSSQMPIVGCTCGKLFGFAGTHKRKCALVRFQPNVADKPLFKTECERDVVLATVAVLKHFEKLVRSDDLIKPENMKRILARVQDALSSSKNGLIANAAQMDISSLVFKAVALFIEKAIEIPKIFLARNVQDDKYDDFELDLKGLKFKPQPAANLTACPSEARLEDYLVRRLVDFQHVCYEHHRQLLYKLAGAVVRYLRSYLTDEDDIKSVLCFHAGLSDFIYGQMQAHRRRKTTDYDVHVTEGFVILRPQNYVIPEGISHRDFRFPVDEKVFSRGVPFAGFKRCLSASQHFGSDAERRFAALLEDENDPTIVKWIKPGRGVLPIYDKDDAPYEPEFLVETRTSKLICDIRNGYDRDLQERAEASRKWCEYATTQEKQRSGKTWSYLLIPNTVVHSRLSWAMWRTQLKIETPSRFEELFG
jgi:hypothetical protein